VFSWASGLSGRANSSLKLLIVRSRSREKIELTSMLPPNSNVDDHILKYNVEYRRFITTASDQWIDW